MRTIEAIKADIAKAEYQHRCDRISDDFYYSNGSAAEAARYIAKLEAELASAELAEATAEAL
jgi:hypothetical protein